MTPEEHVEKIVPIDARILHIPKPGLAFFRKEIAAQMEAYASQCVAFYQAVDVACKKCHRAESVLCRECHEGEIRTAIDEAIRNFKADHSCNDGEPHEYGDNDPDCVKCGC